MSGNPHTRRYLTSAPLTALYGCAALALLGGSLITPRPGSGPAAEPAAAVIVSASIAPPIPTTPPTPPAAPTTPPASPTPSPAPTPAPPDPTPSIEPDPPVVEAEVVQDEAAQDIPTPDPTPTAASRSATRAPAPTPSRKPVPVDAIPGSAQSYAAQQLDASQYACLLPLWTRESGWNANAVNPASGAYGIPQALPSSQGRPYALGDYRAQIDWGLNYIRARYGSPCGAWSFWQSHNWY